MTSGILIVDDLPNWRRQLLDVLASQGYSAEVATNFEEAKQALFSGRFKLAVIDVRLVDADDSNVEGLELLEEIDGADLDVKAIVMTGFETSHTEKRALQSPRCVAFIRKDEFDIDRFLEAVETAIPPGNMA